MLTCKECIARLHPDDPRVPVGKYHDSSCDYYCDKPTYYREIETQQSPEQVMIHRQSNMSKLESDLLQQTALKANYLLKKLNERQPRRKYNTYE